MVDEEFSKRIKDAIALSGKSQRKIAEEMGITPQGLSKAAREGVMARDTLERFCLATGGNFEQLATGKPAPPPASGVGKKYKLLVVDYYQPAVYILPIPTTKGQKMTTYTTIRMPSGISLKVIRDFADLHGLEVRQQAGQLILVDPRIPSNVRRLPARPRPVVTGPDVGPDVGGAA